MNPPTVSTFFKDWIFYEKGHWYSHKGHPKMRFTSSTGLKSKFIREFESKYWIAWEVLKRKYDKRNLSCSKSFKMPAPKHHFYVDGELIHMDEVWGMYPEEIKNVQRSWGSASAYGKGKGDIVHNFLQELTYNRVSEYKGNSRKTKAHLANAWRYFKAHPPEGYPECEVVCGSLKYGITGMVDRLDHIFPHYLVDIWDYKTDKDFSISDGFSNLVEPFEKMTSSSLEQYTIQVNIYREIIEFETPYKVRKMKIANVTEQNFKVYDVPRLDVIKKAHSMGIL